MEHVAKQFMLGPTSVTICDDKCVSREEAEEILKDLAGKIKPHIVKATLTETV